jgi:hypothetical protein
VVPVFYIASIELVLLYILHLRYDYYYASSCHGCCSMPVLHKVPPTSLIQSSPYRVLNTTTAMFNVLHCALRCSENEDEDEDANGSDDDDDDSDGDVPDDDVADDVATGDAMDVSSDDAADSSATSATAGAATAAAAATAGAAAATTATAAAAEVDVSDVKMPSPISAGGAVSCCLMYYQSSLATLGSTAACMML